MTRQAGLLLLGLAACAGPKGKTATAAPHENPFLAASPLQYQAPPFDRISSRARAICGASGDSPIIFSAK